MYAQERPTEHFFALKEVTQIGTTVPRCTGRAGATFLYNAQIIAKTGIT